MRSEQKKVIEAFKAGPGYFESHRKIPRTCIAKNIKLSPHFLGARTELPLRLLFTRNWHKIVNGIGYGGKFKSSSN